MMPSSGHRKVLKAASTRSGRAIQRMSTARRGKIPAKIANKQPISPSSRPAVVTGPLHGRSLSSRRRRPTVRPGPLGSDFGPSRYRGHHPEGMNRGRPGVPVFATPSPSGKASPAGPLQGVAAGVTGKLHLALGGAELLVDDLQRSFHRLGTEATDTLVERMVEELHEQQHRRDHRD